MLKGFVLPWQHLPAHVGPQVEVSKENERNYTDHEAVDNKYMWKRRNEKLDRFCSCE